MQDAYERIDPAKDGWESEAFSSAAMAQFHALEDLLKAPEPIAPDQLAKIAVKNIASAPLRPANPAKVFADSRLQVYRAPASTTTTATTAGLAALAASLNAIKSAAPKLEPHLKIFRVERTSATSVTTSVIVDIEASSPNERRQFNGLWSCDWLTVGDAPPVLATLRVPQFEEIVQLGDGIPLFTDATASVLGKNPSFKQQLLVSTDHWRARLPSDLGLDAVANHGLAIGDINGDELDDLYVCQQGGLPNRLFIQNSDGTLRDITAESGTGWLDYCAAALFLDLDNDGDRDLVISQDFRVLVMSEPTPGRPVAINIWATWCAPCIVELTEWAAHSKELTAAGLDVMAFNTDSLGSNSSDPPADPAAVLKKLGFLFPNARISGQGMLALDFLQRGILDRWKPLPLPVTFLIDGKGELLAIYKGPVSSVQLIADLKVGLLTADQRRDAAVPFPGHWVGKAGRSDPKRVANLMLDHDEMDAAIEYLDRCAGVIAPQKDLPNYKLQLGDIYYMAGLLQPASPKHQGRAIATLTTARDLIPEDIRFRKILAQQLFKASRGEEAVAEMQAAIKINPGDPTLLAELVDLHAQLGQFAKAKPILEEFLAGSPKNPSARLRLAGILVAMGDPKGAIPHYRQTLKDSPRTLEAADELARLLASHPDDTVRSAAEALALAQRLCSTSKETNPAYLDTLSIALANKGDFPGAITAAKKASALLDGKPEAKPILERIKLYEARQPWRQVSSSPIQ